MTISLPEPDTTGETSVTAAIADRRSRREFDSGPVSTAEISQLCWAAQGITQETPDRVYRAAPSAGATYPSELVLEVGPNGCPDLSAGTYRYEPTAHELQPDLSGSVRDGLVSAAYDQPVVKRGDVTIVLAADFDRTCREYPNHGRRYVHMEAGHIAENIQLVCESLGLGTCPVGALSAEEGGAALDLGDHLDVLYLLPVGKQ